MLNDSDKFEIKSNSSAFLQIREFLKMSRRQFGEYIGANEDTIGNWERGTTTPWLSIPQIKRLNKLLLQAGVTWDDLPDNVGDPSKPPKQYKRTRKVK